MSNLRLLEERAASLSEQITDLTDERNRLFVSVIDAIPGLSDEEHVAALMLMYYDWRDWLPLNALAEALGHPSTKLHKIIPPLPLNRSCHRCDAAIVAMSRSSLTMELRQLERRTEPLCRSCRGKDDHESRKVVMAQRIAESDERSREHRAITQEHLNRLRSMTYPEYLRTEHWQNIRRSALRRAGYRCQVCNGEGRLDVHHRTYDNRGAELNRDVTVLCRDCHARHHGKVGA